MTVRTNRQMIRIFFALVICAGIYGCNYALDNWQVSGDSLGSLTLNEESDWVDFAAALGEEMLQLFLGLTSPSG